MRRGIEGLKKRKEAIYRTRFWIYGDGWDSEHLETKGVPFPL